jgi:hypothetical protein
MKELLKGAQSPLEDGSDEFLITKPSLEVLDHCSLDNIWDVVPH